MADRNFSDRNIFVQQTGISQTDTKICTANKNSSDRNTFVLQTGVLQTEMHSYSQQEFFRQEYVCTAERVVERSLAMYW